MFRPRPGPPDCADCLSGYSFDVGEPANNVAEIVEEEQDTAPLDSSEAQEKPGIRFDEIAEQAKGYVRDHEKPEGIAWKKTRILDAIFHGATRADSFQNIKKGRDQEQEKQYFIKLGGMPRDAVSEVYGPREF